MRAPFFNPKKRQTIFLTNFKTKNALKWYPNGVFSRLNGHCPIDRLFSPQRSLASVPNLLHHRRFLLFRRCPPVSAPFYSRTSVEHPRRYVPPHRLSPRFPTTPARLAAAARDGRLARLPAPVCAGRRCARCAQGAFMPTEQIDVTRTTRCPCRTSALVRATVASRTAQVWRGI